MTSIIPLESIGRRIPIVAKLRSGATKGNRPVSLDRFRATSSSRPWIENFADRYGGEVKPFGGNSPHQWEVFSDADEVAIALIEDGYSINYELWSAGGCQRRCNGVTASVLQTTGPDNVEYVDAPCICDRKGELECSLKSRLTFVMPDLPFAGGVVYETSSKNFAEESQGMLALIQQMQAQGVTRGVLRLEQRKSSGGRRYTMAVVGVASSLDDIALGGGNRALASVPDNRPSIAGPASGSEGEAGSPALSAGSSASPTRSSPPPEDAVEEGESVPPPRADSSEHSDDDTVYDAEVVEDDEPSAFRLDPAERAKMRAAFMARTQSDLGLDYETQVKPWLVAKYGGGWSELSDDQALSLYNALVVPDGTRAEKEDAGQRFKKAVLAEVAA